MKTIILSIASIALLALGSLSYAKRPQYFGPQVCKKPDYFCYKVRRGDTWQRLFPDAEERDIVRRVNRMNTRLRRGSTIAVPRNLANVTIYDVAPFPRYIDPPGEKTIFVSQSQLAWGAYNNDGELLWWGPISSGIGACRDAPTCKTPGGSFRVIRKQGAACISTAFPRRRSGIHGGAKMPYCMHFFRGYALHGSSTVPGRRESHGCVRMFIEDAQWLNQEFINLPGVGRQGTRVIVEGL